MLRREHLAILSTFIKLPFVIKIFVLSIVSGLLHRFYCAHFLKKSCNGHGFNINGLFHLFLWVASLIKTDFYSISKYIENKLSTFIIIFNKLITQPDIETAK